MVHDWSIPRYSVMENFGRNHVTKLSTQRKIQRTNTLCIVNTSLLLKNNKLNRNIACSFINNRLSSPTAHSSTAPHLLICRSVEETIFPGLDEAPIKLDRDEYKESSRVNLRTVFDFDRWAAHRSTHRYVRHMKGVFVSRMIKGLAPALTFVGGLSTIVATVHQLVESKLIEPPLFFQDSPIIFNASQPMLLTSTVLGLLLVFRTNASYARWLDARKSWGTLVNRSRDLARQGMTWIPDDTHQGRELRSLLCRWIIAMVYSLKCHLRQHEDAVVELARMQVLPQDELRALEGAEHRPIYCMQVLSNITKQLLFLCQGPPSVVANMDINITAMEDVSGTCERILKTPIPLSYSRHTSRFMIIWLSMLPFALWDSCRWGMVPASVLISLLTLGVEDIGVSIEEPFSILALEQICDGIRRNIEELERTEGSSIHNVVGRDDGEAEEKSAAYIVAKRLDQSREIHIEKL